MSNLNHADWAPVSGHSSDKWHVYRTGWCTCGLSTRVGYHTRVRYHLSASRGSSLGCTLISYQRTGSEAHAATTMSRVLSQINRPFILSRNTPYRHWTGHRGTIEPLVTGAPKKKQLPLEAGNIVCPENVVNTISKMKGVSAIFCYRCIWVS